MKAECPVCEREFDSERAMKIHMSKKHGGEVSEEMEKLEKIQTGIEGFDELLGEGIPKGSSLLIEGGPGSGKTVFCLQAGYRAAKKGDKVLYMSFEEPVRRLINHMYAFDWDVEELIEKNFKINRYNALDIARSVEALLSEAKRELLIEVKPMLFPKEFDPDLVLIDSLTSIASAFTGKRSRFRIYMEQLFKYLEREEITSFLIRETANPTHIGTATEGQGGAVSFLSDGIVALYNAIHPSGNRDRGLEIVKLRGEDFTSGIVRMEILNNRGMVVDPKERLEGDYKLT